MKQLKLTFIIFVFSLFGCNQSKSENVLMTNEKSADTTNNQTLTQQNSDSISWLTPSQFTPISFLNAVVNGKFPITMIDEFPIDWVKESDIDTLMTLINSTRKCSCFLNPYSSYIPINDNADIGGYAIIFINSFRQKHKINLGLYSCPKTDKKSVEEITKWWNNHFLQTYTRDTLDDEKIAHINNVITLFKIGNIDKIANNIHFPLYREYPIPSIKNKKEFKQRFSKVFDTILISKIANSKIEEWSEVGWRGIMLGTGVLWMSNSDDIINAVNYQSDFEKKLRQNLIAKDKQNLHHSLKTFESPIYKIKTKKYLIRIDEVTPWKYRYVSWKIGAKEYSKPDIIINNGELIHEGSGGNHVIKFINGNYTYSVYRNIIGEENTPDITLEIEKNGHVIFSEGGTLIRP